MPDKIIYELGLDNSRFVKGIDEADKHAEQLQETIMHLTEAIGIGFGIREIYEMGKQVLETTAEFEGFDNRIKFASMNVVDAQENLSFLKQEVKDLHLPMKQVNEGFSEMQAGLKGTAIEGENLRTLFDGISKAAATTHLPTDQLNRMMYDLKEIGEIGLNKRLINSLNTTGIGPAVKATFGKTMVELEHEGMSGVAFLEKLGPGLAKYFSSGLAAFGESLQAQMTDTQNAITQKTIQLGEDLKPAYLDIMHGIQGALNSEPVDFLISHMQQLISVVGFVAESWLIYKGAMTAVSIAEGIQNKVTEFGNTVLIRRAAVGYEVTEQEMRQLIVTGEMTTADVEFAASMGTASAAAEGFGLALETIGPMVLVAGIAALVNEMFSLNKEFKDSIEKITDLKALTQKSEQIDTQYKEDVTNEREAAAGQLDKNAEQEAYNKLLVTQSAEQKHILDLQLKIKDIQATTPVNKPFVIGDLNADGEYDYKADAVNDAKSDLQKQLNLAKQHMSQLDYGKAQYEKLGIKGPKPIKTDDGSGIIDKKEKPAPAKSVTITVKIGNLVGVMNNNIVNSTTSLKKMGEDVTRVLTSAVRDSEIVAGE